MILLRCRGADATDLRLPHAVPVRTYIPWIRTVRAKLDATGVEWNVEWRPVQGPSIGREANPPRSSQWTGEVFS